VSPVRTDVTVEAFRRAVRRTLKLHDVNLVTIVAGVLVLRVGCVETEKRENGEGE
jgi:hypothetical protein